MKMPMDVSEKISWGPTPGRTVKPVFSLTKKKNSLKGRLKVLRERNAFIFW